MIVTLFGALLLSVFIIWFVSAPLFAAENMETFSSTYKGFSDEQELNQVITLRDSLLQRLRTGSSAEPRVSSLNDAECFDALVSLCLRLQRAELPYLPGTTETSNTQRSNGLARVTTLLGVVLCSLIFYGVTRFSFAAGQPLLKPDNVSGASPNESSASPMRSEALASLFEVAPGIFIPTSNRYIISPAQAEIVVHHVSSFALPESQGTQNMIVFAEPENLYDWQIVEAKPESWSKQLTVTQWNGMPAVRISENKGGLPITLTTEFRLNATTGRAVWRNEKLPKFPGEQVVVFFEIRGILKSLFGSVAENWNVWPPRLANPGPGLNLIQREVTMGANASPRRVQLLSRAGEGALPFAQFEVIGVVPSRVPLVVLGLLVGAVLFSVALTLITRRLRWRFDAPKTLPQ